MHQLHQQSPSQKTPGNAKYQLFQGTPQSLHDYSLDPPPGVVAAEGNYTINVDRAEVGEVAKLILGETLGLTYVLDPRVHLCLFSLSVHPIFLAVARTTAAIIHTNPVTRPIHDNLRLITLLFLCHIYFQSS